MRSHECDREHSVKSERRSSAKGKLKLFKITFLNRHFLVKEKVVAGEKMLFLCNARKTSFITTLFLKSGAPNENIVQNHINIALLNVL